MPKFVYTMRDLRKVIPPDRIILSDITLAFLPGAKIGVLRTLEEFLENVALVSDRSLAPLTGLFSLALVGGVSLLLKNDLRARFWNRDGSRIVFAFLAAACLCFAVLPNAMPGVVPVYARFSVLVAAGALMVTAFTLPSRRMAVLLASASVMAGVYVAVWHLYFNDFERTSRDFSREFLTRAGGSPSVVAAVIRDPEFRGLRPLVHFNNYHVMALLATSA